MVLLLLWSSGLLGGYCERKTHFSEWGESGKKVTHNNFSISSFWLFCYVQSVVRSPPQPHTHSRRRLNLFSSPRNQIFVSSILFFSLLYMMKNVSGTWYRWWESMKTKKTHISALAAAFVRFGFFLPFQRIDFPWWFFFCCVFVVNSLVS